MHNQILPSPENFQHLSIAELEEIEKLVITYETNLYAFRTNIFKLKCSKQELEARQLDPYNGHHADLNF
mgnify:CR=1 FL=1